MNKKRQQYSAEFKFQVVLEVLKEEKTVSEIASSYELNPNLISRWKTEFLETGAKAVFSRDKKPDQVETLKAEFDEKEAQLYQEIGQLTTQLTWLKKKSEGFHNKK